MADSSTERKIRHLEMLQGVITRMSKNSFLIKGWSVVLVSALFALAAKDANMWFVYLAYFPSTTFAALDAYYLAQERSFRGLYDAVRSREDDQVDFSMNTAQVASARTRWSSALLSRTILMFHTTVVVTITSVAVFAALAKG